jgi:hypothetical protein
MYRINMLCGKNTGSFFRCLSWHCEEWLISFMEQMSAKLSKACYAVRLMVHISNVDNLQSICYAYSHSFIKHGIIFLCNSSKNGKIFNLQKKKQKQKNSSNLWLVHNSELCTSLFQQFETLPVPCQNTISLIK